MLTQERVRELFDYREDGELIRRVTRSHNARAGEPAGSMTDRGYKAIHIDNGRYWLHRVIFLWHYGYLPENCVDHIDQNNSNNRIENLREASKSCNGRNSKLRVDSVSFVTGVTWSKRYNRWDSRIKLITGVKYLGRFDDIVEAAAYRLAAEQCLGWEGCHSSTSAYLYMRKYLESKHDDTNRTGLTTSEVT